MWSPTRSSVFFLTKMDGMLDIWDLVSRQNAPKLSLQVCDEPLHCLEVQKSGELVACGSYSGVTTLLQLSPSFTNMSRCEKGIVDAMFERESRREKIIDNTRREMRYHESHSQKSEHKSETKSASTVAMRALEKVERTMEQRIDDADKAFWDSVNEEKTRIGEKNYTSTDFEATQTTLYPGDTFVDTEGDTTTEGEYVYR